MTDYSVLTDAISFTEVGPAVLVAASGLVGIYVVVRGVRFILSFVSERREFLAELDEVNRKHRDGGS